MVQTEKYVCQGCNNDDFHAAVNERGRIVSLKCTYCERTYLP